MSIKTAMTSAKMTVSSKAGRTILKTQKNSPHILFAVGVVGVVGTAVLASKATLHIDSVLDETEEKRAKARRFLDSDGNGYEEKHFDEDLRDIKVKLARDMVVIYAPAVLCGVATIGAFTGSHVILNRRYTGAVAAFVAVDQAYREYRGRVAEFVGADKERELHLGVQEVTFLDTDGKEGIQQVASGISPYAKLFSKETSTEWTKEPEYRLVFLRCQQTWANDRLRTRGHLFLNEVYRDLGLDDTTAGAVTGWVWNNENGGDNYVDFGIFTDEGSDQFHEFMTRQDGALWLDFNVDGIVYDLIEKNKKRIS